MTHTTQSLRDAHLEMEAIVKEFADLLFVAADDVVEEYGDDQPVSLDVWQRESELALTRMSHQSTPYARRLAEALVIRLLHGEEVGLEYIGDRVLDGHSELSPDESSEEVVE